MAAEQPSVLTFLLTDIEGSTRLWSQHEDVMDDVIGRHDELIKNAVESHGGTFVKAKGEGDSTFSVFSSPRQALLAAVALQHALDSEQWPRAIDLRTRAALHTGEARYRDGDYHGTTVNRCARLRAIGHGGQIVLSAATADLVADDLPEKVSLRDLGRHGLRDLSRAERVYQVEHPDLPTDFAPLRSLGTTRSNLPAQRSSFVGREQEVRTVAGYITAHRIVTLTGVGGCGKTRLAVEVAAKAVDAFDGVYFCDLSLVADPDVVADEVAKALGLTGTGPFVPSARAAEEELLDHLQTRRALLVLDNCEHLIDAAAALVDTLLDACAEVKVLATSREALEVDGERTYNVPSLALPRTGETRSEAVDLFVERAATVKAGFELTDEAAAHVVEICRRLDGIPLAIELAAAQSSALSPAQIEERLSDRFRLLSGGRRRVQRQHTLATMLDWSHDLLDDVDQTALRRLSVFPQPFTLEQAENIVGSESPRPVASSLRSLVSKSLVTTAGDRYRLLETVRLYAEQKLFEAGEADEVRTRHRDYFVGWMMSFDPDDAVWTPGVGALFVPEFDHIRSAVAWSEQTEDFSSIARIVSRGWLGATSRHETARWFEVADAAADLDDGERLRFLVARAWHSVAASELPTLLASANEALTLPPDSSGFCHAMAHSFVAVAHSAAQYLFGAGDVDAARRHIEQAKAANVSVYTKTISSLWIGLAEVGLGDLEGARDTFKSAIALGWEPDTATGALHTLLSLVETALGDPQAALREMERSVEVFATDAWGVATTYDRFWTAAYGPALASVGRYEEAREFMESLVAHLLDIGAPPEFVGVVLGCLGVMALRQGENETAVRLLVRPVETPIAAIDHLVLSQALAEARHGMTDERYAQLCAEGRGLQLADGAALAFAALRR